MLRLWGNISQIHTLNSNSVPSLLLVCGLFNEAVISSHYTMSDDRMINE
jgi:hypothetical protein